MVSAPALVIVPIQMDSLAVPSFQLPVTLVQAPVRELDTPVTVMPVFLTMMPSTHTSLSAVPVTPRELSPLAVLLVKAAAELMAMARLPS
jgi:hypothetical protein